MMKSATFTYGASALLLAASMLCLGGRYAADSDRRAEADRVRAGTGGTTARAVDETGRAPSRGDGLPGDTAEAAMARRLRSLLTTTNAADLTRSVLALIAHFQAGDWPVALEALRGMGLGNSTGGYRLILSAWGEADRAAMIAWAEKHGDLSAVLTDWGQSDPEAAMAWLKAPERTRDTAWNLLMASAVNPLEKDLPALGRALEGLPGEKVFNILVQSRMNFNGTDPGELTAWLETLDPGIQKMAMKGLLVSEMSGAQMVALVEAHPELVQQNDFENSYTHWAVENPEAARDELERLEPGPHFKGLLAGVVGNLAEKGEMVDCLELMRRWPEQIDGDVAGRAAFAFREHPEEAAAAIRMMRDPYRRSFGYADFLRDWFRRDAGAARQWLDGHDEVPDKVREEFGGK